VTRLAEDEVPDAEGRDADSYSEHHAG
jgi:hypothetical protein